MRHETPEDTHDDVSSTRLVDAPNTGADPYHYRLIARALDLMERPENRHASLETLAAAEAAVGLAILVTFFRNRGDIAVDDASVMKG